jgi:hypothetical protein
MHNLFGFLVLRQAAARFFTDDWWSVWYPSFIVWLSITIVGFGRQRSGRQGEGADVPEVESQVTFDAG